MAARPSLAELAAAGFVLHSGEAAAIVIDLCHQLERGEIRGIPSTHVIRLTPDGTVIAEGPITTDRPPIAKAAQLLNDLLPPFDAPPTYRVPGGLRLIVARALGTLDLPPFESLGDFCAAISRFSSNDLVATARNLYRAWEIVKAPRTLTISDLRRARRATGLSLDDISSACGVNAALLRELEWGYLKNWRNDFVGRGWLSGYAKASGLDEQLVTSIVVPMLDEAASAEAAAVALVASGPQALVPFAPLEPAASAPPPRRRAWMLWAAACAASIAFLAIVVTLAWPSTSTTSRLGFADTPADKPIAVVSDDVVPREVAPSETSLKPADARVVPAVQTQAERPRVAKARTAGRRTALGPAHKPAPKPNFFKRQLLRIVIK